MNFDFFHRPEPRKFKYKPRYYNPDEEQNTSETDYDVDRFAERLNRSWSKKRRKKVEKSSNVRQLIWIAFLVLALGFLFVKLFS